MSNDEKTDSTPLGIMLGASVPRSSLESQPVPKLCYLKGAAYATRNQYRKGIVT